jgi:hypothetical protein
MLVLPEQVVPKPKLRAPFHGRLRPIVAALQGYIGFGSKFAGSSLTTRGECHTHCSLNLPSFAHGLIKRTGTTATQTQKARYPVLVIFYTPHGCQSRGARQAGARLWRMQRQSKHLEPFCSSGADSYR